MTARLNMAAFGQAPAGSGQRFPQNRFPPPSYNNGNEFCNRNTNIQHGSQQFNVQPINMPSHNYGWSSVRGVRPETNATDSSLGTRSFRDSSINQNYGSVHNPENNMPSHLLPQFVGQNSNVRQNSDTHPKRNNLLNYSSQTIGNFPTRFNAMQSPHTPPQFTHGVARPPGLDFRFPPPVMPNQDLRPPPLQDALPPQRFGQVPPNEPVGCFDQQHSRPNQNLNQMQIQPLYPNQSSHANELCNKSFTMAPSFKEENNESSNFQLSIENRQIKSSTNDQPFTQRYIGQQWVNQWLQDSKKSKTDKQYKNKESIENTLKISDAQDHIKKMIFLMAKLRQQTTQLERYVSCEEDEPWKTQAESALQVMKVLEEHKKIFSNPDRMKDLQQRVEGRRHKRIIEENIPTLESKNTDKLKEKLRRKRRYEESIDEEVKRSELHAEIDKWQAKIHQEHLNLKQEKEMKASADSTLAEVRKKNSDSKKTIELLKGLQKLRKLRKQRLEKQGVHIKTGSDRDFDLKTSEQIELMTSQQNVYLAEEKALKVMLEVEKEETKEREREKSLRIQLQKEEKLKKRSDLRMFGSKVELAEDDPMVPFHHYYDQANHNLEAFLHIRRDWDTFLVPKYTANGSRIPDGFVVPVAPSSDTWTSALQDQ